MENNEINFLLNIYFIVRYLLMAFQQIENRPTYLFLKQMDIWLIVSITFIYSFDN